MLFILLGCSIAVPRKNVSLFLFLFLLTDSLIAFHLPRIPFFPGRQAISKTTRRGYSLEGNRDVPLSSIVRMPEQFILAPTPGSYIPLEEGQRLVCVGDVHGDFQALVDFLKIAGVLDFEESSSSSSANDLARNSILTYSAMPISDSPLWTGNNTILVQCGDILDRGSEELACYQLLAVLSHQALQYGGRVVCLYGNHEALNAMGLFQYATTDDEYEGVVGKLLDDQLPEYYPDLEQTQDDGTGKNGNTVADGHPTRNEATTDQQSDDETMKDISTGWRKQYVGNQPARWATYEPNGLLSASLMANLKVAVQVGRTICVHAGLTKAHLEEYGGIEGMNEKAKTYMLGGDFKDSIVYNNRGSYVSTQQPWIEAVQRQTTYINSMPKFLAGSVGAPTPLWMRDYSSPANGPPRNPKAKVMINGALEELDCDRMVMGHTVQAEINAALDGKAWRIDVGASRGVIGGKPEVLEIVKVNGTEEVSILTRYNKIPGVNRHVWTMAEFL